VPNHRVNRHKLPQQGLGEKGTEEKEQRWAPHIEWEGNASQREEKKTKPGEVTKREMKNNSYCSYARERNPY